MAGGGDDLTESVNVSSIEESRTTSRSGNLLTATTVESRAVVSPTFPVLAKCSKTLTATIAPCSEIYNHIVEKCTIIIFDFVYIIPEYLCVCVCVG